MQSGAGTLCRAASRGLQRFTVVLLMMNGLASPTGISANPAQQVTTVNCSYPCYTNIMINLSEKLNTDIKVCHAKNFKNGAVNMNVLQ